MWPRQTLPDLMGAGAKLELERLRRPACPPPGGAAPRFFRTQLPQSAIITHTFLNNLNKHPNIEYVLWREKAEVLIKQKAKQLLT